MSPFSPKTRIPVAVLGATGAVGQSFIRFMADHPWFDVAQVAASERSAGKKYAEATRERRWTRLSATTADVGRAVLSCSGSARTISPSTR